MKKFLQLFLLPILIIFNSQAQVDLENDLIYFPKGNEIINFKNDSDFQRIAQMKADLTAAEQKLSTDLLQLIKPEFLPVATSLEQHTEVMNSLNQFKPYEQTTIFSESVLEGTVYCYVYLNNGYPTSVVNSFVEEVIDRDEKNNIAVVWMQVKNLENLASLNSVRMIRTVMPPVFRTGSVNTEGDAVHRTSNVRTTYGEDGTGINVGIISDGITTRATAQATGDLPPDGGG
jgi:hypothetical protein